MLSRVLGSKPSIGGWNEPCPPATTDDYNGGLTSRQYLEQCPMTAKRFATRDLHSATMTLSRMVRSPSPHDRLEQVTPRKVMERS